jgi:hypothetical protein
LNVNAAYRKIPILTAPPARVTYTRANTRSVYRKTIDEIADMLTNQNIRANVLYARLDPKGRGRMQISAELPLIYATGRRTEPPQVHFPVEAENEDKPQRIRKSKREPQPFLRSLPVYRYTRLS